MIHILCDIFCRGCGKLLSFTVTKESGKPDDIRGKVICPRCNANTSQQVLEAANKNHEKENHSPQIHQPTASRA